MALNLLSTSTDALSFYSPFIMILVMVLFMWLFIYRPQKKQQQKETEMRNSLEIGDEVTTIGGIVGRVVAIKEDTFVLETGSDRTKIRFRRAAIQSIEKLNMEGAQTSSKQVSISKHPLHRYDAGGVFVCKNERHRSIPGSNYYSPFFLLQEPGESSVQLCCVCSPN